MSTFVLVHGAWHGAWCWSRVIPLLEAQGHRAVALDLPAHGEDATPLEEVTLTGYARSVCAAAAAQAEPVVLVGHSLGGIAISQAAERAPECVRSLVYLAAFLLGDEDSLSRAFRQDTDTLLPPRVVVSEDRRSSTLPAEAAREILYGDSTDEDARWAASRLCPDPNAPTTTPLHLTQGRFGRIPRFYIECLHDRAVSPAFQRRMYSASPCASVLSLATDHSPFLCAPGALVAALLEILDPCA